MFNTKITELLNVQYPIIQGGMAWIADSSLAAAVSNGGGVGLIAAANAPVDWVRQEIRKTKAATNKPFGVNIMLLSPNAAEIAQMVCDEGVSVVTTGAGNPSQFIELWKSHGIVVIPVIPSVALAIRMERAGADAVVAEGMESGGHIGELTTMTLLPQVVDAVDIPVIAAGGIADGRAIAATMMLGAQGVQVGTRFLVANECSVHQNYKDMIIGAKDIDTAVSGRSTGHPVRVLKNKLTRQVTALEKQNAPLDEIEKLCLGGLRRAVVEGDITMGSVMAGQIAGLVSKEQSAADIIAEMFSQAQAVLGKWR
ncbi:MAG: enoyl-[acyl-carrier-protein] reductase FabK [Hyphomonadaceae bacterium]|nr:enoyl-[acyl-carrier-protein] reductase FabK [Clostridia bacterium]